MTRRQPRATSPALAPAPAAEAAAALPGGILSVLASVLASVLLSSHASGAAEEPAPALPLPSQIAAHGVRSRRGMVVCGHPAAAAAGARVLAEGGNAVDAAVATAFALGVVDPCSAGPGGQATLLVHLSSGRDVLVDGSVRVPLRANAGALRQLKADGRMWGYPTVATPGMVAAMGVAHEQLGRLAWRKVLAPAAELARGGYVLPPISVAFAESYWEKIVESEPLSALLLDTVLRKGPRDAVSCMEGGERIVERLASAGWRDFYTGRLAAEVDAEMEREGGAVRLTDLARIRPVVTEPLRSRYRDLQVLSPPYPAGGAALALALAVLDRFPQERLARDGADRLHLLLEASRGAHRRIYSHFRSPELLSFLSDDSSVASGLAALVLADRIQADNLFDPAHLVDVESHGTTHAVTADAEGNVVSMTLSLGRGWGACVVSPLGFVWNGILEDFDVSPGSSSVKALAPFRAPVDTVTPVILLRDGAPFLALGSAGSGRILSAILDVVSEVVDRGRDLAEAVSAPRALWSGLGGDERFYVELAGPIGAAERQGLVERLYWDVYEQKFPGRVVDVAAFGGVNALLVERDGTIVGVADPRRHGGAAAPVSR